ncbi:MAG: putative ABC exporter domain-containing protein [Vicinamibacterales bacterium]
MFSTLDVTFYVIWCSARNRMRARLRRLKEPRYLLGAIVGLGYLFVTLGIRQRVFLQGDAGRPATPAAGRSPYLAALRALAPALGGVGLSGLSLLAWALPFGSNLLSFSPTETAMLMPSPLSRRQLVIYRLMRSQAAVLGGAFVMALAYPTGSLFARLRGLVGIWLLMTTGHVFGTIVSLAREKMRRGNRMPAFAWPALLLSVCALGGITLAAVRSAAFASAEDPAEAIQAVAVLAARYWPRLALWPFTALVQPFFAATLGEFVVALALALIVWAVSVAWLLWADARSAEVSDAAVERQSTAPRKRDVVYRNRATLAHLSPSGRTEMVFVWKAALRTLRSVDGSTVVRSLILLLSMGVAILFATRARGLVFLLGSFSTLGALFTTLMAPQIVRMDLREDLAHLEWLKAWPVRGAEVLRGEILWPAALVTAVAWMFGGVALLLSVTSRSLVPMASRSAFWLAFLLLIPGVVLAQYTVHNAIAVIFPGWVHAWFFAAARCGRRRSTRHRAGGELGRHAARPHPGRRRNRAVAVLPATARGTLGAFSRRTRHNHRCRWRDDAGDRITRSGL